jgi:myo-inositol-1(or 4)-monophosphatase
MDDDGLLDVLDRTVAVVRRALGGVDDLLASGERQGQYALDLATDGPAVEVLTGAGLGVLSEESGRHHPERPITVVVDPVDGSTNASRGIPWYATSLCAVDGDGPRVAVVVNLATGQRYHAVRGGGAFLDGKPIRPSGATALAGSIVLSNGTPRQPWGFAQSRILGAAALDLCAVASGMFDAFVNLWPLHVWDYLGGVLVCREAGAAVAEADGRDLLTFDSHLRLLPFAAASPEMLDEMLRIHGDGKGRPVA